MHHGLCVAFRVNLARVGFLSYYCGSEGQTKVFWLGNKHLYLVIHPDSDETCGFILMKTLKVNSCSHNAGHGPSSTRCFLFLSVIFINKRHKNK